MADRPNERMVKLADGRQVSNYSEEYRHETECRWLLTEKPTRTLKHMHLYGVADRQSLMTHDKQGRPTLREGYTNQWMTKSPLMKFRGIEGADRLLSEAKKLYELTNQK